MANTNGRNKKRKMGELKTTLELRLFVDAQYLRRRASPAMTHMRLPASSIFP
jgi:hypothetical protein